MCANLRTSTVAPDWVGWKSNAKLSYRWAKDEMKNETEWNSEGKCQGGVHFVSHVCIVYFLSVEVYIRTSNSFRAKDSALRAKESFPETLSSIKLEMRIDFFSYGLTVTFIGHSRKSNVAYVINTFSRVLSILHLFTNTSNFLDQHVTFLTIIFPYENCR